MKDIYAFKDEKQLGLYRLIKDLPDLPAGVIFTHIEYSNKRENVGNIGCGALVLAWKNGSCQGGWCGGTYIFPGQLAKNKDWFERIDLEDSNKKLKEELLNQIEELKQKVSKL